MQRKILPLAGGKKKTVLILAAVVSVMAAGAAAAVWAGRSSLSPKEVTTEAVTRAPSVTAPATESDPPTETDAVRVPEEDMRDYLLLRGGRFHLTGALLDAAGQRQPLELAVTPDSLYMNSEIDGAAMGMLVSGGVTYLVYPPQKCCLALNSLVMSYMGLDPEETRSRLVPDFSRCDPRRADAVETEAVNGADCRVYIFYTDNGSTRFYLNGGRLVRLAFYDAAGEPEVINEIDGITDQVPPEKTAPPADYRLYEGLTGLWHFEQRLEEDKGGG